MPSNYAGRQHQVLELQTYSLLPLVLLYLSGSALCSSCTNMDSTCISRA